MEDRMLLSNNDLERLEVLNQIKNGKLKQSKGAKILGISIRQTRRLLKKLIENGPNGIVSQKIGKPGNHQLPFERKTQVLAFFHQAEHYDFGPTLTQEYLGKSGLKISVSSVRKIMIQNGLWHSKKARKCKIHLMRERRVRKGELIQLDGSEHDWFEGRGPRCTLLVFIDDATSETLHLKFVKSENVFDYFSATREYIEKCGRPEAFYPDRHSVFRVNRKEALTGTGLTQFGRAMKELEITLICANSPQAKGRVERRNRDFQNRLVKALRVAKICNIEAANAFLPAFLEEFNQQFAKTPKDPINAHRPLLSYHDLDRIFCLKNTRRLSKNLTLQYNGVIYQVIAPRREYALRKAEVTILETKEGEVSIEYLGKKLSAVPYHKMQAKTEIISSKELLNFLKEKKQYKPNRSHPWKKWSRGLFLKSSLTC